MPTRSSSTAPTRASAYISRNKGGNSDVLQYSDGIHFRELAPLGDALEELTADGKLEREVVLCARFKPFVELYLRGQ